MDESKLSTVTRLSIQRALLGAITPNIRLITIGWSSQSLFQLLVYFENEPSEEEIENIDCVCTEVNSDIAFETNEVRCVHSKKPINELETLKWVVYLRKE
jgi:hypothetical protein